MKKTKPSKAKASVYYNIAAMLTTLAVASVSTASLSWIHSPEPPKELLK
ncbi:cyclic lactone autoinducer peptide [Paenibacillus polymyxa]|nr:cyclic lactone autoinducer peptide [Paenibacillus polymyxa]RGL32321.1 cyclic lactone autoinducer peptide [Paenibacillus polymyxa]WHX37443.1 cyclic lactone autoinducer peptide [Paenibacillus polymyxa]